ncbi:alpha/beta fold hydrolase [Pseudorhodoplanes sp.]|uniref:alpha/beta fold hydrolase n=1 Tax=Pseudorhodoplanes sp. TaxID=1934341 RepID=UPI003D1184AF
MPDLDINGGSLRYCHEGAGEAVVFVSGLGGSASFWSTQVATFRERFHVVTFDHRGIGGSSGKPPYTVAQWCDDLLRLVDGLAIDRCHLVGHSTGGIIAQNFAAENPDRVRTLSLGGSWLSPDRRFRELFALRKDVLVRMGDAAYRTLGDMLAASFPRDEAVTAAPTTQPPHEVVLARIDALLAYRGEADAERIRVPTLVVAAADDHIVPSYLSRALADAITGSRLLLLVGGGHFFPRTRSATYNKALSDFWAEASEQ